MVSVIIPVNNGALYLREAVESVIEQNIANLEIIIVDDGSTDNTKEIVDKLPYKNICYHYQENGGPSKARNTGIRAAKRNFIAFLDSDDLWPPRKLATQLSYLERTSADLVGGLIQYLYMPGSEYRQEQLRITDPVYNVHLGALVIRKQLLEKVGLFNEMLRISEDLDWVLKVREKKIPIPILDEVMLMYRVHPSNLTKHKTLKDLGVLTALKLSLDRKRSGDHGQSTHLI
jgi:glycosyltransferase involved in cell wall biosynthesis